MPELTQTLTKRLGISWCLIHHEPVEFCCRATPTHNWSNHNALRKYASLMVKGQTHPFRRAGGQLVGVKEGESALADAIKQASVQRLHADTLIATKDVVPTHLALLLRGAAPEPLTGNSAFEATDHPTVIRAGKWHVIGDGHHRLSAMWAKGDEKMKTRVIEGVTPVFKNSDHLLLQP